jgi:hypothetical protein
MKCPMFAVIRLCLLVALSAAPAAALTCKAPAGVKLPLVMTPVQGGDAWSGAGADLVLVARQGGLLEAPAWFTGNRPPRDEMVVLELEYLDNVKEMATVEVYSGLSTDRPFDEVHRFGGLGDRQWRTARAPAPADMLYLHLPSGTVRFRLASPGGALKIRSARLVAPQPDEQARYEAACRDWVARAQKRGGIDPTYWELAQAPALPERWTGHRLVPFARNYMDLVLPISAPRAGEAGAVLSARMFLNEYEPLQLGVYANGADLKGVAASVDPVRDSAGKVVAEAELRVAEYSLVKGWNVRSYFVEPFPQRLWPAYSFDVPAGRSHMLFDPPLLRRDRVPGGCGHLLHQRRGRELEPAERGARGGQDSLAVLRHQRQRPSRGSALHVRLVFRGTRQPRLVSLGLQLGQPLRHSGRRELDVRLADSVRYAARSVHDGPA